MGRMLQGVTGDCKSLAGFRTAGSIPARPTKLYNETIGEIMNMLNGKKVNEAVVKFFSYKEGTSPEYIRKDIEFKNNIAIAMISGLIFTMGAGTLYVIASALVA